MTILLIEAAAVVGVMPRRLSTAYRDKTSVSDAVAWTFAAGEERILPILQGFKVLLYNQRMSSRLVGTELKWEVVGVVMLFDFSYFQFISFSHIEYACFFFQRIF